MIAPWTSLPISRIAGQGSAPFVRAGCVLEVPLDVRILDVGGGVGLRRRETRPWRKNVRSEPLSIFLQGLLHPSAWSTEASSLSFGDVMGNAPRTMRMLEAGAEAQGASLAIVGSDYLNLSLRMGYHFSVVDVFLGPQQSRNYVYFRFAGGLAAGKRRERRARLIERILESMDFMVTRESDLVVGRLKPDDDRAIRAAVAVLGSLTAYFRQLDTVMRDDADVDRISDVFSSSFMQAFVTHWRHGGRRFGRVGEGVMGNPLRRILARWRSRRAQREAQALMEVKARYSRLSGLPGKQRTGPGTRHRHGPRSGAWG